MLASVGRTSVALAMSAVVCIAAACSPATQDRRVAPATAAPSDGSLPYAQAGVSPLVVEMELDVLAAEWPLVRGVTNLPDGMILAVNVAGPFEPNALARLKVGLPACIPDCWPWQGEAEVSGGVFLAMPTGGVDQATRWRAPRPGLYRVTVGTFGEQSAEVSAVIGVHG